MKAFCLVVLFALIALVYSDKAEMMFGKSKENKDLSCIGIKLITGNKPGLAGHVINGSSSFRGICCKEPFDSSTKITGFNGEMTDENINKILKAEFGKITTGKTKCVYSSWAL